MAPDAAPAFLDLPGLAAADRLVLDDEAAHYLVRVIRVTPGDRVRASDGAGCVATLEIVALTPRLEARVCERRQVPRTRVAEVWCGAPEGDRADWLVEKLGELGIAAFQPVDCARARWAHAARRQARWERLASAALRQSRGAHRLEIRAPGPLAQQLERAGAGERWVAHPDGGAPGPALARAAHQIALVGPASGFDDEERARIARHGFVPIALAASRLRTETAALAWAARWAAPGGSP